MGAVLAQVGKSDTIPVPTVPTWQNLQCYPYPCTTLATPTLKDASGAQPRPCTIPQGPRPCPHCLEPPWPCQPHASPQGHSPVPAILSPPTPAGLALTLKDATPALKDASGTQPW